MNNAKWIMVLGIALLVGFFLPWMSMIVSLSGFDMVRMAFSGGNTPWQVWLVLVMAIFAVLCIVQGARGSGHRPVALVAGAIFPLLVILGLIESGGQLSAGPGGPSVFSLIGIGAYLCLAASIGLLVCAFRKG